MKLTKLLKYIHFHLPAWISNLYMPLVGIGKQLTTIKQNSYLIEGNEKTGESILRVIYIGNDLRIRDYWIQALYKEVSKIQPLPKASAWKIRKGEIGQRGGESLMLLELSNLTRRIVKPSMGFVLPRWFDTIIETKNTLEALSKKETQRHIRKHGFSYELRNSLEDLEFFYTHMFTPLITDRHKDAAVLVDFSYFKKKFHKKDSILIFLMKDGEAVAASFNERKKGMIKFSGLGVLNGDREIIKMGAMRALYYFMISYYHEKEVQHLDFGGTSPILTDGLTQFKLSMRAIPNRKNSYGEKSICLLPLEESPVLQEVLKANPFVFLSKKRFYRALFVKTDEISEKKTFLKLLKRTNFKLDGTQIFSWGDQSQIRQWVEEENLHDHELRDFPLLQ